MSRTPNPLTNPPSNPQILSLFNPGKTLRHLKQFHAQIITHHNSPFQLSALASLSALSPFPTFLAYAKTIFHHLQNPPPSLYNSLTRALSSSKTPLEALPLHHTMLQSGLKPDHMTYPFVIKACNESSMTWFGLLVHTHVVKSGFECDSYIVSSLIHGNSTVYQRTTLHLYTNGKDLGAAKQLLICVLTEIWFLGMQ
ncbi:putative pentatricopeptide repeat-containing protein [Vitis vinifera]|uniref:Putative pentatricopeptide repeat-containing protein n=1 Tax=Vitis vinifera TaxID=29760 RepID=A0A438FZ51_VITVI|nr:putative pentatricopeptide repeat-containing protein [Vitis vinifera]